MSEIKSSEYKVIISSGHKNFHMIFTASELYKRDLLLILFCGGYPKKWENYILSSKIFNRNKKINRFLNRKENISDELICQNRVSEFIDSIGLFIRKFTSQYFNKIHKLAFNYYGWLVRHKLKSYDGNIIYHFRAGYGQSSILEAKQKGMITICDHSIAHPVLIDKLIENNGQYPEFCFSEENIGFWKSVLDDIKAADYTLVNSEFVKETFVYMGYDPNKIHVIYQGVEDKFIKKLPIKKNKEKHTPLRFLFAGGIGYRKGIEFLAEAMEDLYEYDFELHFAGVIQQDITKRYEKLFQSPKVHYHGMLSQSEIANLMIKSDVFIFPSLVEGSARVIFEAMAAGCAIICTPNSGSVNIHDETGLIIEPGNANAIVEAILYFVNNPCQSHVMGEKASKLIKENYTQKNYGDALERLYIHCLNNK